MKRILLLWLGLISFFPGMTSAQPISLHPRNPHYFSYHGQPTILITSAEHYGAVVNLDFDYRKYLDELQRHRLNHTRTWAGAYIEPQGAFNIASNTLAPGPERFIAPWARSDTPGYANGGNKFDLNRWDESYFKRLKDFLSEAATRNIVVELNLFCPFYDESQWKLSPQNANNNVNGVGNVGRTNVYTLDQHGGLLAVQEAMVRKIVTELKDFDNLYYEICNEPYFGGVTLEWQHHIADVIQETEKPFRHRHLISRNVANGAQRVTNPHPGISVLNFHYAAPPTAVSLNYDLNRVIGDNETGFKGTNDFPYRSEAWNFMIAGGGLFNHLDYSFVAGAEDGTFAYPASQPGGGSVDFRKQMQVLRDFIYSFDFIRMRPEPSAIRGLSEIGMTIRTLANPGKAYAIYLSPPPVPKDDFSVRWTGKVIPRYSEEYTFHTFSNDGVRLWVDGKLIINNWTIHSGKEDAGKITLQADKPYDLKLEYYQSGGNAAMKLSWSSPSQSKEVISGRNLRAGDGILGGLEGSYFLGKKFEHLTLGRRDPQIDFDWSESSPFAPRNKKGGARENFGFLLELPAGKYKAEWVNPITGAIDKREKFEHAGGSRNLISPQFEEDMALRIKRL